jgi:ribonuclease D
LQDLATSLTTQDRQHCDNPEMPRLKPPTKEQSQLLPPYIALADHAIHVPNSDADFAQARTSLLAQSVLGFDTESKPIFSVHQKDNGPHLVQLATPEAAWLLQLHHPLALALAREVLSDQGIRKVGFGLDNDRAALPRRLDCMLNNVVDLDRVFQQYGYGSSTGVRAAMALVLGQGFHKSKKTSTSNWAAMLLSPAQLRYAANDAHAPALIDAALPAWQSRQSAQAPHRSRMPRAAPTRTTSPGQKQESSLWQEPEARAISSSNKKTSRNATAALLRPRQQ